MRTVSTHAHPRTRAARTPLALAALALLAVCPAAAQTHTPAAQTHAPRAPAREDVSAAAQTAAPHVHSAGASPASPASAAPPAPPSSEGEAAPLETVRRQLRAQQAEIERLRAAVAEQSRLLAELLARTERTAPNTSTADAPSAPAAVADASYRVDGVAPNDAPRATAASSSRQTPGAAAKNPQTEQTGQVEQLKKTTEAVARQLGSISFSGDVRLRYEMFFGQLNALPNAANPAAVGNELTPRYRARLRARLALRGQLGPQFDWGLRFATGTPADVASPNQTLTDFFGHKQFALDQAYVSYRPAAVPGLRLQGGKFEIPWLFTEMTIDTDVQPEGFNETYSRDFKHKTFKNLTLVAWQLPMLERQSGFVLDSAGRVQLDATRRAGRDLALYGAQARARLALGPQAALTLSAADLYYSGTQFISPAQFFGGQFQVPVTVTIPATATSPAQTVTAVVNIPRELLVSGSGLGVSAANTNAVNRDGRLSSGYNLVDLIARLELTRSRRFPVTLLLNFVTNTQARDVVAAGPGGATRTFENDENHGIWAEAQVGRARERGDVLFNYTFIRIEKDAVLTPFNYSDLLQGSDVRTHRLMFTYAADPRVLLTFTSFFADRPNGLLGVFGQTPAGSLDRPTTRLQFDTVFRF